MNLPGTAFLVFGSLCVVGSALQEGLWLRRRGYVTLPGRVVDFVVEVSDDTTYYKHKVECAWRGEMRTFVSKYGHSSPPLENWVKLSVSPESGENPEVLSLWNRFGFTVLPLVGGVIFIWVGLYIEPVE